MNYAFAISDDGGSYDRANDLDGKRALGSLVKGLRELSTPRRFRIRWGPTSSSSSFFDSFYFLFCFIDDLDSLLPELPGAFLVALSLSLLAPTLEPSDAGIYIHTWKTHTTLLLSRSSVSNESVRDSVDCFQRTRSARLGALLINIVVSRIGK